MLNYRTPILVAIILTIAVVAGLIGYTIFHSDNPNEPPKENETTEIDIGDVTHPSTDTIEPPSSNPSFDETDDIWEPDVKVDVLEENEKHEKPNEPTIEGEPFIGDGYKEDMNEENK